MDKGLPPLDGDQNKAAKTITIWAVLTSLSVTTVTLRFIARAVGNKRFGWDDWTMLAALVRFLMTKTQRISLNDLLTMSYNSVSP